jgi:hypothetical protein
MKWFVIVAVIAMSASCADRREGTDQPVDTAPAVEVPVPADSVVPDSVMARDTARLPAER